METTQPTQPTQPIEITQTTQNMIDLIDARLKAIIDDCNGESLREAMSYSVFAGGKRLRPMLLLGACEAASGSYYNQPALDFACSLEMIHTYSLIHDDLPAMDNDDFRRGVPTNHKKFGEAMAILAGDALLNRAFETMARVCVHHPEPANLEAMLTIVSASGDNGMISGQVNDILFQNKKVDGDTLFSIHSQKTGALFASAFFAGATIGGGDQRYVQNMLQIGSKLGVVFQILDDILDVTSTQEELGKPTQSDKQKNTYVSVHGLSTAKSDYKRISTEILVEFDRLYHKSPTLRTIVEQALFRKN